MNLDIIATIVQGGAVGLMVLAMLIAYKIAMKLIGVGQNLVTNHLNTLTQEVQGLRYEVATLPDKLATALNRRIEE